MSQPSQLTYLYIFLWYFYYLEICKIHITRYLIYINYRRIVLTFVTHQRLQEEVYLEENISKTVFSLRSYLGNFSDINIVSHHFIKKSAVIFHFRVRFVIWQDFQIGIEFKTITFTNNFLNYINVQDNIKKKTWYVD